ncbi:MAG TPA: hypothetical protein VL403_15865 [Candidatus Kryptonia bacterium]|nr:hypothetical protein [Candidatus Kryptonia bacterium]
MRRLQSSRTPAWRATATALLAAAICGIPARIIACDLCAIYSATEQRESRTGFRLGVAEQYTFYGTLQNDGREVANPAGERLNSFITQFVGGYTFTPRLGAQINLPLIGRAYRRQEANNRVVDGDETGLGDLSLVGNVVAFSDVTENSVLRFSLLGGLKLPTGNSHRIKEELIASQSPSCQPPVFGGGYGCSGGASTIQLRHNVNGVQSGIHGHDLALGSGSVDGIIGTQLFGSWKRAFVSAAVQYMLRTEGSFGYTYANDLIWSGGPGAFLLLSHDYTIGTQLVVSGETKGNDTLQGTKGNDTAITALYLGPGFTLTWGTSLAAEIAADLPVLEHNTSLQIVPDYRLRAGVSYRF